MSGILKAKETIPLFLQVDEHSGDSTPIVIGAYERERLAEELLKYPSGLFTNELVVNLGGGVLYHLALHRDWKLTEERERHRSQGSCAEYLAVFVRGRVAYLIQVLKPKRLRRARTSRHRHKWKEESWHLMAGAHPIISDDGVGDQVLMESHTVAAGVFHQLKMRVAFFRLTRSLLLLEIVDHRSGLPDPLGMGDYDY